MMPNEQVTIRTRDGDCPSHVMIPAGGGPWPAVIFYMDAGGVRPVVLDMAQRLADAGYVVLLPDLFYRYGPYGPFVPKEVFAGDVRAILGPLMAKTGNDKAADDTEALLAYLDTRNDVAGRKVGAVGFCMGGGMALAAAGTYPDRFAAVASFHGGNLATDAPTSPHLFAPKLKAEAGCTCRREWRSIRCSRRSPTAAARSTSSTWPSTGTSSCASRPRSARGR